MTSGKSHQSRPLLKNCVLLTKLVVQQHVHPGVLGTSISQRFKPIKRHFQHAATLEPRSQSIRLLRLTASRGTQRGANSTPFHTNMTFTTCAEGQSLGPFPVLAKCPCKKEMFRCLTTRPYNEKKHPAAQFTVQYTLRQHNFQKTTQHHTTELQHHAEVYIRKCDPVRCTAYFSTTQHNARLSCTMRTVQCAALQCDKTLCCVVQFRPAQHNAGQCCEVRHSAEWWIS